MQVSKQPRIKSRSGCEQCKRRKVKCDEKRPICTRCLLRKETCTGNFSYDIWQIERPWISHERAASTPSALENKNLRHWYDSACLSMAIFYPPANPLSHALSGWLRHSKALRHTLESVSEAHQNYFLPEKLSSALQTRGLAISSLQKEIDRLQSSHTKQQKLLRTTILSSLILFVSSAWLDPSGNDVGIMFLSGISATIGSLADSAPTDPFAFYLLGLYLYLEAFSSFLLPSEHAHPSTNAVLAAIQKPPFDSLVHPVTGVSSTLCPLISDAGRYFRWVLDSKFTCTSTFIDLEKRLCEWTPPATDPQQDKVLQLAEGYRSIGLIMLYQANAAQGQGTNSLLMEMVLQVMETIRSIPNEDPLLNWVGPLLVITGPELPSAFREERRLVETTFERLARWTRIQTYNHGLALVREVWKLKDLGIEVSWLEVMLEQGRSLAIL
ncbi:sterol regulatory element-binding protein ecm22 [Fusarium sporotrichioides]|uniref:Sterol regulatory element-binding protein ecm22 n=1 Tax=Fusarium sporotrichioides TaxID=5514 RepID=A0A395RLR7_FUSSP|nr:sterol regulatory element-binding protein ecm22 [Fusarium sporotrichioides]